MLINLFFRSSGIRWKRLFVVVGLLWGLSTDIAVGAAYDKSSISFINRSGVPALVKLVGPSRHVVEVANNASQKVNVAGGSYHLLVRYGTPGKYRYSKGDPFTVRETATEYEEVTITLHTVAGGNYDAKPSSPEEFTKG